MLLLAAVLSIAVSGCSTTRVTTDHAVEVDFARFQTFAFRDTGGTVADSNQLMHRRILAALQREMAASGLTESGSDPDVYVSYYGAVDEQMVLTTQQMAYGPGAGWQWQGNRRQSTLVSTTHRVGTLVIDVWDAGAKELVWRADVSDVLSRDPQANWARIDEGIARAFQDFPPTSAP